MRTEAIPDGPGKDSISATILQRWPETVVAQIDGATFFSLDESNWPNYATIVWTDGFDMGNPSDLARPGVFRLNIGLGKESFARIAADFDDPEYWQFDRLMPHPIYAKQHWVSILNPSHATFREIVMPLLVEAHDRLASVRQRQETARR
jgi:hypothetical protein